MTWGDRKNVAVIGACLTFILMCVGVGVAGFLSLGKVVPIANNLESLIQRLNDNLVQADIPGLMKDSRAQVQALGRATVKLERSSDRIVVNLNKSLDSLTSWGNKQKEPVEKAISGVNNTLGNLQVATAYAADTMFPQVQPTLENLARITGQVNDALPLWLDCEGNPSCAFNLYQGTAKSIERASQTIAFNLPQLMTETHEFNGHMNDLTEHAAHMTGAVDKYVSKALAPRTKKQEILFYISTFGILAARLII